LDACNEHDSVRNPGWFEPHLRVRETGGVARSSAPRPPQQPAAQPAQVCPATHCDTAPRVSRSPPQRTWRRSGTAVCAAVCGAPPPLSSYPSAPRCQWRNGWACKGGANDLRGTVEGAHGRGRPASPSCLPNPNALTASQWRTGRASNRAARRERGTRREGFGLTGFKLRRLLQEAPR
jgi:hypothetical protein